MILPIVMSTYTEERAAAQIVTALSRRGARAPSSFVLNDEYRLHKVPRMTAPVLAGRRRGRLRHAAVRCEHHGSVLPVGDGQRGSHPHRGPAVRLLCERYSHLPEAHTSRPVRVDGLRQQGCGLDPVITAKLLQRGLRRVEVSVASHGRSYDDGENRAKRTR